MDLHRPTPYRVVQEAAGMASWCFACSLETRAPTGSPQPVAGRQGRLWL